MTEWSYGVVIALCGVAAVVLAIDLARDRAAQDSHFIAMGVIEVALVAQLVGGAVALGRTDREVEGVVFVSYLVTLVLVPIVGAFFSLAERSRVGTSILLLAVATVAGLELRVWDIWGATGG
ncbi:hypothetical protein ACFQ0K_18690 [Nocardioides caeni]|uniref:Integral membrane protein n=1 Tax=Nocardioides caeni TaxID=574700 RepID=A0A4S8NB96_9ACTN|nr:hypothetical protein [Nocardioides caeni]THV13221.1 hypothetical protein E9934_09600 [Nocardioides caeni]